MARQKIPYELMTEEQKKRRDYNEKYRNKDKNSLSNELIRNEKKSLRKTKITKLMNEKISQLINSDNKEIISDSVSYKIMNEKNTMRDSNIIDLFTGENLSFNEKIENEDFKTELLTKLEEVKKENEELRKLIELNKAQHYRRWLTITELSKKLLASGTKAIKSTMLLSFMVSLIVSSSVVLVTLSSEFYEQNLNGVLSAGVILFGSFFFSFVASHAATRISKWGARLVSYSIISMNLLFSMNGLLDKSLCESGSYVALTGEIARLKNDIEVDSKSISTLPETYTSAKDKKQAHKDLLTRELKVAEAKLLGMSPNAEDPIKVAQPFMVRFVLEIVLLMLLEMFFRRFSAKNGVR